MLEVFDLTITTLNCTDIISAFTTAVLNCRYYLKTCMGQ
jgi:hypothetical protein